MRFRCRGLRLFLAGSTSSPRPRSAVNVMTEDTIQPRRGDKKETSQGSQDATEANRIRGQIDWILISTAGRASSLTFATVSVLQPLQNNARVQPSRVRQDDLLWVRSAAHSCRAHDSSRRSATTTRGLWHAHPPPGQFACLGRTSSSSPSGIGGKRSGFGARQRNRDRRLA